jgi:hypothetical protein
VLRKRRVAPKPKAGIRAVEKEQGKGDNPGEPAARAERGGNLHHARTLPQSAGSFLANFHRSRWTLPASLLIFFTSACICDAAKEFEIYRVEPQNYETALVETHRIAGSSPASTTFPVLAAPCGPYV